MPFYFRKSLRFGPVRFNLSKSGIGVSAGIKGLRVGTGPRGNYIHAGLGGVYYRGTFRSPAHATSDPRIAQPVLTPPETGDGLIPIESTHVSSLTDSDASGLLAELNGKRKKWRLWPVCLSAAAVVSLGIIANSDSPNNGLIVFVVGLLATIVAADFDRQRRTSVLFYELGPPVLGAFEAVCLRFDALAACQRAWHIEASGRVADTKYSGGAGTNVRRKTITLATQSPAGVKTNISTPAIPVGRQQLVFFPDRMLVMDPDGVGAVSYVDLQIQITQTRFVEDEGIPRDAQVVGETWRFVNKKGGPDRRFRNNSQIPIALYEKVSFTSSTGLNEEIHLSQSNIAAPFVEALGRLAQCLKPSPTVQSIIPRPPLKRKRATKQSGVPVQAFTFLGDRRLYYFSNVVEGPFPTAHIKLLLDSNLITLATPVCLEGEEGWKTLKDILYPHS